MPQLFIGSSVEGLPIAELFRRALLHNGVEAKLWTDPQIFEPSKFTLESLELALDRFSYALIVLSPDDITQSRGVKEITPRDNLIFELGLFVGRYGRRSVFFAIPDSMRLRILVFLGVTDLTC